jgi:Tfp pilus assembly protein PilX
MKRLSAQVIVLWIVSVSLLTAVVILILTRFESLENERQAHERQSLEWRETALRFEQELEVAQAQLSEAERQLRNLMQPQSVAGPAQFPISRVLARENDTVSGLAKREKTTAEVVYALNPWLKGKTSLVAGQAIWIPTP